MPELTDLLGDLAGGPSPVSGLRADDLFTAGRRRRRRRRTAAATGVALVTALTMTAAAVWWPTGGTAPTPAVSTSPSTSAASAAAASWAVVVDASHAYALVRLCPPNPAASPAPAGCQAQDNAQDSALVGTEDGGRTWTRRGVVRGAENLAALGPDVLLSAVGDPGDPGGVYPPMRLSTDGGKTWTELADGAAAVPAVPTGGAVVCRTPDIRKQACKLSAVDPATRRIAPLTAQPDVIMAEAYNAVDPGGKIQQGGARILVSGADRRTGRPAVAVSADRGRTWTTHVFKDLPCPNPQDCGRDVSVQSTADGTVGYVVVDDRQHRIVVYRQQAGGDWARSGPEIVYDGADDFYRSFVTADGAFLLGLHQNVPDAATQLRYTTLRAGSYGPVELDGVPATAMPVRRSVGGVTFYTFDHPSQTLYQSVDGRHFTRFPLGG